MVQAQWNNFWGKGWPCSSKRDVQGREGGRERDACMRGGGEMHGFEGKSHVSDEASQSNRWINWLGKISSPFEKHKSLLSCKNVFCLQGCHLFNTLKIH
jgi:hypothetical protein